MRAIISAEKQNIGNPRVNPPTGEREWSGILQQDRCCDVESRAVCHWPKAEKAREVMKLSQKTCLWIAYCFLRFQRRVCSGFGAEVRRNNGCGMYHRSEIYPVFLSIEPPFCFVSPLHRRSDGRENGQPRRGFARAGHFLLSFGKGRGHWAAF